ncbi:MAG TPA: hypothetical protein ENH00_02500 [Actinobacteria bacterium]|nr:hypothetical protein [Actinomycetota bacterium]
MSDTAAVSQSAFQPIAGSSWGHLLGELVWLVVDGPDAGLGERAEAHVSAGDGPFVVLFGEEGSDEADDRGPDGLSSSVANAPHFNIRFELSLLELKVLSCRATDSASRGRLTADHRSSGL